jgi:hypothetical protein
VAHVPTHSSKEITMTLTALHALAGRLEALGATEVLEVSTAKVLDDEPHLHDCTEVKDLGGAVPAAAAELTQVTESSCACWEPRTTHRVGLGKDFMDTSTLEQVLDGLERFRNDLDELQRPAAQVIELKLRSDWLARDLVPPRMLASVHESLMARKASARASLLEDFRRLSPLVDAELAKRALPDFPHTHPAFAPARSVLELALEEARRALASSPRRFLARIGPTLVQDLLVRRSSFEAFALEASRLTGDVHLLSSALLAVLEAHPDRQVNASVLSEVLTEDAADVLETAAVLASDSPIATMAAALEAARAL